MRFLILVSLLSIGCGCSTDSKPPALTAGPALPHEDSRRLEMLSTAESVNDGIHLRTELADIEMGYIDVESAIKSAYPSLKLQEGFLTQLSERKSKRVFIKGDEDNITSLLETVVAPALLEKSRAVVVDRRSNTMVTAIFLGRIGGIRERGQCFCLLDRREFLRWTIFLSDE